MKTTKSQKYIMVIILILASFLRLYKLSTNPPSLFGDELDLGYQAYSILKTGNDYQGNFLPLNFHSLAEWRTPLYLYSAVPTVAIFGISAWGVRLPAAVFGVLSIWVLYLLVKQLFKNFAKSEQLALVSAGLMAISPWHMQYSRAGFEVTEMLFFLILGSYLFLKALENKGKHLWLSIVCLLLTSWTYSTAKLFTPFFIVFLVVLYRKELLLLNKTTLLKTFAISLIIGLHLLYGIFFAGGSQRFNYISVFSDPTTESEIGFAREREARIRGEDGHGLTPTLMDRFYYNKFSYWSEKILKNYLSAYSTHFLFIKGDPNLRQSVGIGEFYRIEIIALLIGFAFVYLEKGVGLKSKMLLSYWLLTAPFPSALTVDGGDHATRLILLLPPLLILISYGWIKLLDLLSKDFKRFLLIPIAGAYLISITFYLHEYYGPYLFTSERWWHFGWGPAISEIKKIDQEYDRVIISMAGEPAWIFFAGYYEYDPNLWQKEFPIGNDSEIAGFGKISHTGKFYFGTPQSDVQVYGIGKYIDSKTLYLANAKESGDNYIMYPESVPSDLRLLKTIPYPSGEPAFYIFSGKEK